MDPTSRFRLLTSDPEWTLVDRYFSGECTPDEAKAIDIWVMADPSHERLLASMRRVWLEAATPPPVVDEVGAWRALRERLRAAPPAPVIAPISARGGRRGLAWRWAAVAASIVAIGAGSAIARRHAAQARLASQPFREYTASRGQRSEVTLVDGTRVWLNADSRLFVAQGYGATAREVGLLGEAYFVVQHDAHRAFRLHTSGGVLEDLGTEFDARDYATDSQTVVIVASGRVSLRPADAAANGGATELEQGQMGTLDRRGMMRVVDVVDVDAQLGWVRGQLQFSERPLREVTQELERWYDIDVAVDDTTLLSVPVTASFTTQSADEALSILTATLGVHYTRDGRSVRIHRDRGRPK